MVLLMVMFCSMTFAQYTTKGDGKTYSFKTLSEIEESGVQKEEPDGLWIEGPTCSLHKSITIAEGDKFVMDDSLTVLLEKDVNLIIEGEADFQPTRAAIFKVPEADEAKWGASVRIKSKKMTTFENCDFRTVGLEMMGEGGVCVRHCSFSLHDGSSAAALYFISAGAESMVENCQFLYCQKAAIGSAANASQPLTIKRCAFVKNSVANGNVPQVNITAANKLVIDSCLVEGNPENNMVGGIGISNFMSFDADIEITRCQVKDNRYGVGLVGPAKKIYISNCELLNNKYESNAMNGGSGISLYDPYMETNAWLAGNRIEGNLWGVTIIGCEDVCLGKVDGTTEQERGENVFKDNGNNGLLYDLYNNSVLTVYAQNNIWGVGKQTKEQIESVIFHRADKGSLGEVIYMPAKESAGIQQMEQEADRDEMYYSINGVRRSSPVKGINIIHGKKVVR